MLEKYVGFICRWRWLLAVISLVILLGAGFYAKGIYGSLDQGGFDIPGAQSTTADGLINRYLGGNRTSLVLLVSSTRSGLRVDTPAFKKAASQVIAWLTSQPGVIGVSSYFSTGQPQFVANNRQSTYILAGLSGSSDQQANEAAALGSHLPHSLLKIQLGGDAVVNAEATQYAQQDLARAERYIFPLSAILLVIIFGGLVAAGLPLIMGLYGIVGALFITRLTTYAANISTYVVNLISLLGMGLAIDYSLFIVSRYREELVAQKGDTLPALRRTMSTAGRTVTFSALTVMIALLGLVIFPVDYLRSMGIGGAVAVFAAALGAVTLLPTMLAMLGPRVNALSLIKLVRRRPKSPTTGPGNWSRIAKFVLRFPVVTVLVALVVLLLAGIPFLSIRFVNPSYSILPVGSQARAVGAALSKDFPANSQAPIQVVVKTTRGSPSDPTNLSRLQAYAQFISNLPEVATIDNPLNTVPQTSAQLGSALTAIRNDPKQRVQLEQFLNGNYALINVVPQADTYSSATKKLVQQIRAVPLPAGLQSWVGGQSADLVDLLSTIKHDGVYALIVVLAAMFVLFFLMLGSIVIPLKTIILNVLSLAAAFGSLVWVFQEGHLINLFGATPTGGIDATQPVLIFALAFGLSMDYAVFLFSRVKEQFDKVPNIRQATAWGIQKTGSIITSAALLLLVVIGGFATGSIVVMKEVAVGLVVAVTVDVVIVRLLLVPAGMVLLGSYNWWAPGPLKKLHARFGITEGGG